MKNFAIYLIGVLFIIGGLAYGAHLLGVATQWIWVGVAVIVGIGIMTGIVKTRSRRAPVQANNPRSDG